MARHLRGMHEASPPGHVFAFDWSGLQAPEISFYTAWEGEVLAPKALDRDAGEIKSMRTGDAHLGKGAGETRPAAPIELNVGRAERAPDR